MKTINQFWILNLNFENKQSFPKFKTLRFQVWRCERKSWFLYSRQSSGWQTEQEVSDAVNINNILMREFFPPRPSLRYRQRGKNVLHRRPRPHREIILIDNYFNHPNRNKRKRLRRKRKRPGFPLPLFLRRWRQTKKRFVQQTADIYWWKDYQYTDICTRWPCTSLYM